MPVFAALLGSLFSGLVSSLAQFMSFQLALKFAAYTVWIALTAAFVTGVAVCLSSLLGMLSGGGGGGGSWVSWFWIGLGMFIPSNAAAVVSCVGSIWIGTSVYKLQKQAVEKFAA